MNDISETTTMEELAVLVSQALETAGITPTLSGGAAVSLYSDNEYKSSDLDFVSSGRLKAIGDAIAPLGFHHIPQARQFEHPKTKWYVEFPPGPIAFGDRQIQEEEIPILETEYGPLRIVTPTQIIMDRMAAYTNWHDNQSLDQAKIVASRQGVDWKELYEWAKQESMESKEIDRLKT